VAIEIRLQKYIADCGVTSRRKAEEMILQGRVQINGHVVMELGTKVNPDKDAVSVDGHFVDLAEVKKIYVVLHKPRCVMSTASDPEGRTTVLDLCKEVSERIYPVGRLDYLSEGLIILTNDGELANMVMHPRYNVVKTYEVKLFGLLNEALLRKLRAGANIEGEFIKPLSVRVVTQLEAKTWIEIRLGEGKNREIRRLCEAVGLTVDKLKRVAIGGLSIEGIAPANYRFYSRKQLMESVGIGTQAPVGFFSSKKTIASKRLGRQDGPVADAEGFRKFRRETYYGHIKKLEDDKKQALLAPRTETPVKPAYKPKLKPTIKPEATSTAGKVISRNKTPLRRPASASRAKY
jgi:23S rRNA pseudouridine2605 synthase